MKNSIYILALALLVALLAACGTGGGSAPSISQPTPAGAVTVDVAMEKVTLASAESTTVTATVMAGGKPVEGATVTFATTAGMGSLDSSTAITNVNGTASAKLTAAVTTGVAEATVSTTIYNTPVSKTMPYYVNMPSLKLSTPTIASGATIATGATTTISVNILDANGAAYTAQDVNVYFASVRGVFNSYKVRSTGGVATVTYYAPTATYALKDTVTATLGASTVSALISISPISPSVLSQVSISKASLLPGETSTLVFSLTNPLTTSVFFPDQKINFSIILLSGTDNMAQLQSSSSTTDASGNASVILKSLFTNISSAQNIIKVQATLDSDPKVSTQSSQITLTRK